MRPDTRRTALALGFIHALVDGGCAFILFHDLGGEIRNTHVLAMWIALYNVAAFALQAPAGWLVDRMRADRSYAAVGSSLVVVALVIAPVSPRVAAILAGLGNALFHVGAGAHVLASSAARATEVGLFVGPGAVGLALGIAAGGSELAVRLPLGSALALSTWGTLAMLPRTREGAPSSSPDPRSAVTVGSVLALALLLVTVALRSLMGGAVSGAWRDRSVLVVAGLAAAACCGKMLGGVVGDRLGWTTTVVGALLVAGPIMGFALTSHLGAWLGALLVQITMPLTLKAIHLVFPSRPGTAFGLASATLLAGAAPGMAFGTVPITPAALAAGVLGSMVFVTLGLALLERQGVATGPRPDPLLRRWCGVAPVTSASTPRRPGATID